MTTTATIPIIRSENYGQLRYDGAPIRKWDRLRWALVLGSVTALGSFSIDTFQPGLPLTQSEFHISAADIQLSVTAVLFGFTAGQLLVGPWSDRIGRRLPLILSIALFITGSLCASVANEFPLFCGFRFLQGVGAAASGVVAVAMVRDMSGGRALVRILSRLALVNGLAPILSPLFGSYLLKVAHWREVYWITGCVGFIIMIVTLVGTVETHRAQPVVAPKRAWHGPYLILFQDPVFIGATAAGLCAIGTAWVYLAGAPFLFQTTYAVSPQVFGWAGTVIALAGVITNQIAAKLLRTGFAPVHLMFGGMWALALGGAGMVVTGILNLGLGAAISSALIVWLGLPFVLQCVAVLQLLHHGAEAATATSAGGALACLVAGLVGPLVSIAGPPTATSMGIEQLLISGLGLAVLFLALRPRAMEPISH